MKLYLIFAVLLLFVNAQGEIQEPLDTRMRVGQIVPGNINPEVTNQKIHPIYIEQVQKKYLFIRLSTFDTNMAAIGLYTNMTGELIFSCFNNTFDTCYVPANLLSPNKQFVILVMSNSPIKYNLYTYWGDLQHLKPDQETKFMFDQSDRTQLFHLDLDGTGDFSQIRITLRPETIRTEGDSLKIFANRGYREEPTQEKHDYESIHVWNDVEAIFINKQQVVGEKGIAVYIVGNAKTVYILTCEFIRKDHHNINLNENLYEYISQQQDAVYHMKFDNKSNIDVYVVRFSVFTGEVEVGFYYDKEMNNFFRKLPYQYMSDLQFHIDKTDLQAGTKDLYMKVRAKDTAASTFQVNLQGRKKVESFELYENLFEFVPINEKVQSMHFYSHIWNQNQFAAQKVQTFDISMIKVEGDTSIEFYKCLPTESEESCKERESADFSNSTFKLNPVGKSTVGTKVIYTIEITQDDYKDINSVQKRALIIIHVRSVTDTSFVALEVSNSNKIRLLREGRSFQDKVRLSETKYYKYQNNNPNAGIIKIHINQISGLTKIQAFRSDSKSTKDQPIKLSQSEPNTILISEDVTKPIFIQITGVVTSIYTISVSSIHKEHPLSSSLTMSEDVQYELKLMPYAHTNIELHPIEGEVVFEFNTQGGSISVCEVDLTDKCRTGTQFIGNKGQIKLDAQSAREVRLRLSNNVNTTVQPKDGDKKPSSAAKLGLEAIRTVKVSLLYHATGNRHCQEHKINKLYSKLVKSGSCFKFQLPLAADIEILSSRENLGESQQIYFVCSSKVVPEQSNNRYVIKGPLIAQLCNDFPNDMNLSMILYDRSAHEKTPNQIRMDFSVEYLNDIITLADGVAYYTRTRSVETSIKTFFYEIVDDSNSLQIVLMNKKGNQYFFAKIVENSNRYNVVNEADATINSKSSDYYANPSIQIKSEDITKAKCGQNCLIIISVFSREKPGMDIEFGIQVTQQEIMLKQGEIRSDFLAKGSVNYYQYSTRLTPTDLLFKISDNNRKCAISYLSNHPFPSPSNYISYENQGSLTYKNAQKGRYYFAIQAIEDCPYTVSVNEGSSKLTKIQYGQYYDFKLNEGEEAWFYLRHLSKSSFKILGLLKHGAIDISVNKTDLSKETIDLISSGKMDQDSFRFKNSYQNALTVSSDSKDFCSQCYYLVYVRSKAISLGSLFLGSESSKISLDVGKVLFDEIKTQNSTTLAIFYKISNGSLILNVFSGKVSVEMSYQQQRFEKTFEKNKKSYNETYQFTQIVGKYSPIQIKITALSAPAVYSFELYPFKENTTTQVRVSPGLSSYFTLKDEESVCFTGTLRSKEEYIYVSQDSTEYLDLASLKVDAKLNNQEAKIDKEVVGNILSLKFDIPEIFFAQAKPYIICLQPQFKVIGFVSLSVIQNEKINLISSDNQQLIRQEGTFAIHQNGFVIIDLFECFGKADITYGSVMSELDKKNPKQLDVIGISGQNHAMRVESQEVLFVKVKLGLGSLLWMPLNEQKQRGVGYYKYSVGKLAYTTGFNIIKFMIGGVYKSKQTNTSVQSVRYNLYISNSREQLQRAVMCEINPLSNVISVQVNSSKVGDGVAPQIEVSLQKKKINDVFKSDETLYFNVVAELTLVAPNDEKDHEHYRFVYFEQLVLAELLKQNIIEEKVNYNMMVTAFAVVSVCLIAVLCVFVKWVIPAIGRMRSRVLVEDNNQDVEMEAPPSSDRNQMATGTTERMES